MKIYCDEAGFTGKNLLSQEQPYFVYSAVCLTDDELEDIYDIINQKYKIQSGEIKGSKVVNSSKGRLAILEVFTKYSQKARIVFHDKKYALAGKIVESAVEPYLKSNTVFYNSNLHNFIATGLYSFFISQNQTAEELFVEFEEIARNKLSIEDSSIGSKRTKNLLINWVLDLVVTDIEILEYNLAGSDNSNRWLLDLTITSLLGLLSSWSKEGKKLNVICDNSKVFDNNPIFEMIQNVGFNNNKTDMFGTQIGYDLAGKIITEDSKDSLGIQIADLFSSSVFYCLKNKESDFSKTILGLVLKNSICSQASFCIMPDLNPDIGNETIQFYNDYMNFILEEAQKRNAKL